MRKLFTLKLLLLLFISGMGVTSTNAQLSHLVISQAYGGGGNTGATYKNDFVEIFNPTANPVDVSGWSVQYASSSGSSWQVTLVTGIIPAGGYYLIQEAAGTGGTTNLPTPDAIGTIPMSGTSAKLALVSSTAALSGTCPTGGPIVDFLGFGTANCFEGTAAAILSNTTASIRANNGCIDTDINSADFSSGAPNPRNASSPLNICGVITKTIAVSAGTDAAEPSTNGSFTLNLNPSTTSATDINFSFTGTAAFGTDYTVSFSVGSAPVASTGTLTVPQGTATVTINIITVDDALVEGTEAITLTLSSPTQGYTLGASSASINLADNEIPTASVVSGTNSAEPSTAGSFNISLSNPAPPAGVTINYALSGTASLNTDYNDPQNGSINIPAGSSSGTISLNIIDDNLFEGNETVIITLSSASNGFALATASANINIADDDPLPAIVINEVYGGGGNSGADYKNDFIELYNPTSTAVNLSGWSVQYGSATGATWAKTPLTGTIVAHGHYLIQEGVGAGGTLALPTPNDIGTLAMSGTAGKVALVANNIALTGACPTGNSIIDLVGFGATANCFEGAAPTAAPSNTSSVQRNPKGFDTNNNSTDFIVAAVTPRNSVVDNTPPAIIALAPADDASGVATSFTASITFSEIVQRGIGTISIKRITDGTVVKTYDVTTTEISVVGATISFDVNSLAFNTAYYVEINAGAFKDGDDNLFAGITGTTTWNFTTSATPPAGILGTTYTFNTCSGNLPDGFTQFNILGQQIWACSAFGRDAANPPSGNAPNGLGMNGFANGIDNPNEDWLISPSFDLTGTTYPLLSFWSRTAFAGSVLQLKVSTNYSGTGDPTLATWSDINGKFPGEVTDVWTLSQDINLSAFKSANTYFAFVYTSTTEDGARWTLDDFTVTNSPTPPPPSITITSTDIQYTFVASGTTADKTFAFTGNDLTGNVNLSATGAFLLSKDGSAFSQTLSYTVAEANNIPQTVFVRFAPTAANQNYSGIISISTSGVADTTINLKGTSIDPATTLEVVNWNMEWFGSPTLGPVDDNLQQQNASNVINTIGADIYGVVEIVDEARLQNVVSSLNTTYGAGTYSYIICNYGSHVNPPDPAGGPLSVAQKEAFIYKTALFSNISTRALINNTDINSTSYNSWSSGRYPFLMTADVTLNCVTRKINFVLVHAKANTAPTATAYARRQAGANELHDTLNTFFANENVIMLGDFNDDLDQSITAGFTTTSYSAFTTDNANFFSPTLALSLAGKKSTVSYNDVIDHVIISNEMEPYYMPASATILTDVASLINKYGTTTTDHYPVFTRYVFPNTTAPAIAVCTDTVKYCANTANTYTIQEFTATDDCNDVVSYSYSISGATNRSGNTNDASGTFNTGTSTITWVAVDSWGNQAACSTTVVINASPAVTISANGPTSFCPGGSVVLSSSAAASYLWSNSSTASSITVTQSGNYLVTITDDNGCSNTSDPVVVTADDHIVPIVFTKNITVQLDGSGNATINALQLDNGSSDNCSIAANGYFATKTNFTCSDLGVNSVTLTVTDASGNSANGTSMVTVVDNIHPTISAPANISIFANSGCNATGVALGTPVTQDNCHIAGVTNNAPTIFPAGTTTVTWTVKDDANNTATATQTVTVKSGPQVAPITGNPVVCRGTTTQLADITPKGTWSSSNNAIATVSNKGLVKGIAAGTAIISYSVSNSCSTTAVTLPVIVNAPAAITSQPQSVLKCTGESVTFSVVATGSNLTYQWKKAGVNINGATSSTYTITNISTSDISVYTVTISASCGAPVNSAPAILLLRINAIIAVAGINGSISPGGISITPCGSTKRYNFTPKANYHVSNVLIDGVQNAAAVTNGYYTFANITDSHIITVSFTANTASRPAEITQKLPGKFSGNGDAGSSLHVQVLPNPSSNYFNLKIHSNSDEAIGIKLFDAAGKVIGVLSKISRNSTVRVGDNFINGTYFAEVVQGKNSKVVQLVKIK